jgi:hypothetical protein
LWTSVAAGETADLKAGAAGDGTDTSSLVLGYGAMPGGLRAPAADTLPGGVFSVSLLGGYGQRSSLLTADHKMTRSIGDVAFAFAPTDMITLGLAFDGRFDKHEGVNPMGDDGYVGDPRFIARIGKALGKSMSVGGQLTILVPGKDAPSVAANAISVEARGLFTVAAGPGRLSFNAGFRLDNSAKSVVDENGDDNRMLLSAEDRVSLGVSDFNAALVGAYYQLPIGKKAYVGAEGAIDLFFGKDDFGNKAPGPIIQFGAVGGLHVNSNWRVFAFLQGAKVPGISAADATAGNIVLVPYAPTFTGGLALAATFGGKKAIGGGGGITKVDCAKEPTHASCKAVNVEIKTMLSGKVVDDTGAPVAGGKVTVRLKGRTGNATTDEKGEYVVKDIPIGKDVNGKKELDDLGAEVTVEVSGKKPKSVTLTLTDGPDNKAPVITLDPVLPPGQFKAVVRAAGSGTNIKGATVTLNDPANSNGTTDAEGNWSIDIQPGTYKATASAPGYKPQTLEVVVEQGGVIVKQFELTK